MSEKVQMDKEIQEKRQTKQKWCLKNIYFFVPQEGDINLLKKFCPALKLKFGALLLIRYYVNVFNMPTCVCTSTFVIRLDYFAEH